MVSRQRRRSLRRAQQRLPAQIAAGTEDRRRDHADHGHRPQHGGSPGALGLRNARHSVRLTRRRPKTRMFGWGKPALARERREPQLTPISKDAGSLASPTPSLFWALG